MVDSNCFMFIRVCLICSQTCNPPTSASSDVVSCSQSSVDDYFNSEPWRTMISDLEPNADRILAQFNVRSVLEMVSFKCWVPWCYFTCRVLFDLLEFVSVEFLPLYCGKVLLGHGRGPQLVIEL